MRGVASVQMLDDVSGEYSEAALRCFGGEQGAAWVESLRGQPMAEITVTPTWVHVLDFVERFSSALSV